MESASALSHSVYIALLSKAISMENCTKESRLAKNLKTSNEWNVY